VKTGFLKPLFFQTGKLVALRLGAMRELAMITDGIKYAAVGIDDPDAVLTRNQYTVGRCTS
jgi:hypothetical protein